MLGWSGAHPPKQNRRQVMRSTCESQAWLPHGSELAIVWQQRRGSGCRWNSFLSIKGSQVGGISLAQLLSMDTGTLSAEEVFLAVVQFV